MQDELCLLASSVTEIFSIQMLLMMGYGFLSITAQFYFMFCAFKGQHIPVQLRSAQNIFCVLLFITYTTSKCMVITYVCHKTKSSARKTAMHLHNVTQTVNEEYYNHIANHMTLKQLNQRLDFTVCGFFELDMATIFKMTTAICSYLIILIQFNNDVKL